MKKLFVSVAWQHSWCPSQWALSPRRKRLRKRRNQAVTRRKPAPLPHGPAIDLEKRIVTVKAPKDEVSRSRSTRRLKNLSSVKVGDKVVLNYFKSIAYQVSKPGEAGEIAVKAEVKRVGAQTRLMTKTATIQDIDRTTNNVVLKGPEGNLVGVKVKDPGYWKRSGRRPGCDTYTEALAISLEKATTP